MATTHVVSLFLPFTINFEDKEQESRPPSPTSRTHSRRASAISIATRHSTTSLLDPTPPRTPGGTEVDDAFPQFGPLSAALHFAKPGDPHSLVRNDAHLPDWGKQAVFNQPQSRAGLMPSGSILDFAKAHEDLQRQRKDSHQRARRVSPKSRSSRAGSHDRAYEDKTWSVVTGVHGNGGLTNAIRDAKDSGDFDVTWVGSIGFPTDSIPAAMKDDISDALLHEWQSSTVYVKDKDLDGHYVHYSKTILWPIFNYQVPDHPKSKAFLDHSYGFYKSVNQAFADNIIGSYKKGDIIWVHDYHLLLVPRMVREKCPDAQIGFFLHTAFPSSEVFRCLAMREDLLNGMLGADLIAFQTDEYAQHFLQTCSRLLTVETVAEGVQMESRFVNVTSCPIGINLASTQAIRETAEVQDKIDLLARQYKGKKLIVARDKLDHIRGVRQKLLAFELFLNRHPEWASKVVLIQVATSTSESSELLSTVTDIVTRIDSVHSSLEHGSPLKFLQQDIPYAEFIALCTVADILMITSLRDGMNLTCHEYVICQDGTLSHKKWGPLILSEFTGSAVLFGKSHLSVNPWDFSGMAEAIKKALEMGVDEKARRWTHLHEVVQSHTGGLWFRQLAQALEKVHTEHGARDAASVPRLPVQQVCDKYKTAERRVFFLDYEGTLAPHRTPAGLPLSSPQRVLDALNELISDPKNTVYVMSGRKPSDLESDFRTVKSLGLIAENGCFVSSFGSESHAPDSPGLQRSTSRGVRRDWTGFPNMKATEEWKTAVKGILQYYLERLEGSYIEERNCSLIFRFDKATDQDAATRMGGECSDHINDACNSMRVRVVPIRQAVLIESLDWSKRSAANHILDELRAKHDIGVEDGKQHTDFLFIAGDDREDEVVFRWANELGKSGEVENVYTVSVGKRNTEATSTLTQGTTGLLSVLGRLTKISADAAPRDYFNSKMKA
ncbi:hypothetical protein B0A48_07033 [Cryoendolithus antarcticus]|uniref:Uncharacterized protein n=1 Tax=Cryoendolithus antarcticus TaxID=1507870 RepID=A0A1V8T7E4_9PEZI|nr:hypothetical protein B0A48_07033 [Cryoendolithus antarcticus]